MKKIKDILILILMGNIFILIGGLLIMLLFFVLTGEWNIKGYLLGAGAGFITVCAGNIIGYSQERGYY